MSGNIRHTVRATNHNSNYNKYCFLPASDTEIIQFTTRQWFHNQCTK